MTKVIILGEDAPEQPKKPIKFVYFLNQGHKFDTGVAYPNCFANIELICSNYLNKGFDLMFAYDDNRNNGVLYLGHINDGVVE